MKHPVHYRTHRSGIPPGKALLLAFLFATAALGASAATLRLGDPVAGAGGRIQIPIIMIVHDYENVAGIQFSIRLDGSGCELDGIIGGAAALDAGKSPSFRIDGDNATVIVAGMNLDCIAGGAVAYVNVNLTSETASAQIALESPILSGPTGSRVPTQLEDAKLALETDEEDDTGDGEDDSDNDDGDTGEPVEDGDDTSGTPATNNPSANTAAYNAFGGGPYQDGAETHTGHDKDAPSNGATVPASYGGSPYGARNTAPHPESAAYAPPSPAAYSNAQTQPRGLQAAKAISDRHSQEPHGKKGNVRDNGEYAQSTIAIDTSGSANADAQYLDVSGGVLPGISRILVRRVPADPRGVPLWQLLLLATIATGAISGGMLIRKRLFH